MTRPIDLGLASGAKTYWSIALVVATLLVAGLVAPFVVGEPQSAQGIDLSARERDLSNDAGAVTTVAGGVSHEVEPHAPSNGGLPAPSNAAAGTAAGTSTGGTATAPTPIGGDTATPNAATDVGVTADRVKFAFMIPDTAGAASLGFDIGLGDQADMITWFAQEANEAGGVHGRLLEAVPILYDAVTQEDHTAKCVEANEDHKVFAGLVVTAYHESAVGCFTATYKRVFTEFTGASSAVYPQSEGRLFTIGMSFNRIGANAAWELHRLGLLKSPAGEQLKVGIIGNEENTGVHALIDVLHSEGVDVEEAWVGGNQAQIQSQIPVRVNQLRAAGVEVMILTLNLINSTIFVQQAEGQGWFPEYRVSDLNVMTARGAAERMPESFDGALGVTGTRSGELESNKPPQPQAIACLESYERHAGRQIEPGASEASSVVATCATFQLFLEGLRRAGPNLTTATFSEGLRTWTSFEPPGAFVSSFGPQKFDATDQNRIIQWRFDCKCYSTVTEPVITRY